MLKLTVLGASGGVGGHAVRQALAAGHQVTAVVRATSKVALDPHPSLEVVVADVMDPDSLASTVAGRDAVLSALGPPDSGPSTVMTDSAASMVRALPAAGVRRLVAVSVAGIHTEGDGPVTRYLVKPILGRILRNAFADARGMEQILGSSDLDWTIVCPPRLLDKPAKGTIRSNTNGTIRGGFTMTRPDVATYLLEAAADKTLIHQTAVISN